VVASRWVVGGPRLKEFERRFAALCGSQDAVGVSSWTTGAFLVLHSLGIGPGDEVLVPSLMFIASVNVIAHAGAWPVFVDVEPGTWNIDPADVLRKVTPRTKAIIAVDQLGMPCHIDDLAEIARSRGLRLIQDAACAFASRYRGDPIGARADISVFSLHARKVVTTAEGGMVVTRDKEFAARLRRLRHQEMSISDFERHSARPAAFEAYPEIGFNFRMTDIQAAIGLAQLDSLLDRHRYVAQRYLAALANHPCIELPRIESDAETNWQSFQIRLSESAPLSRNALINALFDRGVPTRRGVMTSHREAPIFIAKPTLPVSEDAADRCLKLPIHPGQRGTSKPLSAR
jgi:perosamine synthetase